VGNRMDVGDRVTVSFSGVVEEVRTHDMPLGIRHVVRSDTGSAHMIFDQAIGRDFTVEKAAPDYWPPEKGDVWKADNGKIFFARATGSSGEVQLYESIICRGGEDCEQIRKLNLGLHLVFRNL